MVLLSHGRAGAVKLTREPGGDGFFLRTTADVARYKLPGCVFAVIVVAAAVMAVAVVVFRTILLAGDRDLDLRTFYEFLIGLVSLASVARLETMLCSLSFFYMRSTGLCFIILSASLMEYCLMNSSTRIKPPPTFTVIWFARPTCTKTRFVPNR